MTACVVLRGNMDTSESRHLKMRRRNCKDKSLASCIPCPPTKCMWKASKIKFKSGRGKMPNIKDQKLLYHLTSLNNLGSILRAGLQPRARLKGFSDVADHEILQKRSALGLENYVPFHWFSRNPFDGGVQSTRRNESFVMITVQRTLASQKNWKVIPRHPLANDNIQLMDYAEGFQAIDWEAMNRRDYHDPHSKSVCMAECLSPTVVPVDKFFAIYVPNASIERQVRGIAAQLKLGFNVDVNKHMFL